MNPAENIELAIKRLHVTTSAQTDKRILDDAFAALEQAPRGRLSGVEPTLWRLALSNRIARFAAIIVLGIAILAAVVLIWSEVGQEEKPIAGPQKERIPEMPVPQTELARELARIEEMFAARDIDGLVAMLSDGEFESKVAVAKYLGQIGDSRAIEPLSNLASQWQGDPKENPFSLAVEQIKSRQPQEQLQQEEPQEQEQPGQSKSEFEPKGVLCGFVTDAETGEPVTDARVTISIRRIHDTEVDANGFYCFEDIEQDGNHRVEITSSGYIGITEYNKQPTVSLKKGTQVVKNFRLERACQVEIRVIDEAGDPIKGARVTASSLADDMGREVGSNRYLRQTDDEGLILLGGFKPADTGYLITVTHTRRGETIKRGGGNFIRTLHNYAPAGLAVELTDPNVIETAEIVLKKGVDVQGCALYSDGVPAEGLEISAHPHWWHCTHYPEITPIDADGRFTLTHILPGQYSISVHIPKPGGGGISYPVLQTKLPLDDEGLLVTVPKKSPGSLVSISGKVTFAGDKKPDYVEVSAYSPGDRGHHSVDLHGGQQTFTLDSLEPGAYTVSFSGPNVERKVVENVEAPCPDLRVELTYVIKPTLRGSVVKAGTGEPVTKFRARVRKVKVLHGSYFSQSTAWNEFDDPRGNFDIEAVGPGVYQVQVAADGFAWVWSGRISSDDNQPVVVELIQGGAVEGTVLDAGGRPVGGAKVIPLSKAGGTSRQLSEMFVSEEGAVETDSSGKFRLEHLPPGRESIKVKHADFAFGVVKGVEVVDGRTTKGIEVVLSKGGGAEGYVYDVRGKPQAGVTLLFQDKQGNTSGSAAEAGRLATAITDSNGFYRVGHLPEQTCYVRRANVWQSLGVVSRVFLPENGMTTRLDFGGEPAVSGQLVVGGRPLAKAKVVLCGAHSPHSDVFRAYVRTGDDGLFWIGGVPVGRYGIYYEVPETRSEWLRIGIVETAGEDVDVGVLPEAMGTLVVSIETADGTPPSQAMTISLQQGNRFFGTRAGSVNKPVADGEPCRIANVPPGTYTVIARRADGVVFREPVELKPGQEELDVVMRLPRATASVTGRFSLETQQTVIFWRSDKKVFAYVPRKDDDTYEINDLPAGRYMIGTYVAGDGAALVEFNLSEGEVTVVDIDTAEYLLPQKCSLQVQVFGENGAPLTSAKVWLEGPSGAVEPLSNMSGTYSFVAESGGCTLHAVCPGYAEATREVQLAAGALAKEPATVLIRLTPQ